MARTRLTLALTMATAILVGGWFTGAPTATARPGFLPPVTTFASYAGTGSPAAVMTPSGTVVVGRDVQGVTRLAGMQVRFRRPGGQWSPISNLQFQVGDADPRGLKLYAGPSGWVAAVWQSGPSQGYRFATLGPRAARWSSPTHLSVVPHSVLLDGRGHVWAAGRFNGNSRVEIFAPDGGSRVIDLPTPPAGFAAFTHDLALTPDGAGRLVYSELRDVSETSGGLLTCEQTTRLLAADIRGAQAETPTLLETYTARGSSPLSTCPLDGPRLTGVDLVTQPNGALVLVQQITDSIHRRVTSWVRRPGRAWPATSTVIVPDGQQYLVAVALVGDAPVVLMLDAANERLRAMSRLDNRWSGPRTIIEDIATQPTLAGGRSGGMLTWYDVDELAVKARRLSPGLALGPLRTHTSELTTAAPVVDARGNGGVVVRPQDGGPQILIAYDHIGPRVTKVKVPERAKVGRKIRLRAVATDEWSGVRRYTWRVGKTTKTGREIKVKLRKPGRQRVKLTVADGRGTATVVKRTVVVTKKRQ